METDAPSPAPLPAEPLRGTGTVVGLDIGGSVLKAVVVRPDGSIARRVRQPTGAAQGPAAVLAKVVDLLRGIQAQLGGAGDEPREAGAGAGGPGREAALTAVGLASLGWVDDDRGVVRLAVNVGWADVDVVRAVSGSLGCPVGLSQDARAGGTAEGSLGAARGARDFLFLPVGTGIGSAVFLDGQARKGAMGLAGEIGHLVVQPRGPACRCGGRGCLEAVASAQAVARRYRELVRGEPVGAAEVRALAENGDPHALEVWSSAVSYLGQALAFAQRLLDLELVVIGGGLAQAGTPLLKELHVAISERLAGEGLPGLPRLALAELGDEAGSLGAALLARSLSG